MDKINLRDELREHERCLIVRAIIDANNNKAKAARTLGLNRTTLIESIRRLGLSFLISPPHKRGRYDF